MRLPAPLATKVELKAAIAEAVAPLATKAELAAAIAPLATKVELEMWGGALVDRMDRMFREMRAELAELRAEMRTEFAQQRTEIARQGKELQADLSRQINAALESIPSMIRPIDDKYADLPARRDPRGGGVRAAAALIAP